MSDRPKISPETITKVSLIGAGLVAAGIGSLFSFQLGDPYLRLRELLSFASVGNRVEDSTIDTMRQRGIPPPVLPQNAKDLKELGQLFSETLPSNIGQLRRPGRRVIQGILKEL